jgi:hypothetical protein
MDADFMACNTCNKQIETVTTTPTNIINTISMGVVGLTKAVLQIDSADRDVVNKRRLICKNCEELNKNFFCGKCGCLIAAKTTIKSEICPKNKW